LVSASIEIERSENPGSLGADCSGLGHFHVRVNASDDRTPAADLGFDLSVVDGTLPFKFPSQYVESFQEPTEDFSTWFSDDGSDFAATVEVRVVDRAGNVSDPIDVRVTSGRAGVRVFHGRHGESGSRCVAWGALAVVVRATEIDGVGASGDSLFSYIDVLMRTHFTIKVC
jgi:hypothetical protein